VLTAGLAAKVLGQDFAPYLDVYMKTLVSIIENVEDVPDDDVDPFGEDDDDDDMGGMKSAGQGPMGINPAAMNQTLFLQLNNKAKAVKTLGVFAEHLGPLFAPHVGVAVEKACAMLNYAYLEKVREKAATSLVSLYKAATGSDKDKSKLFSDIVHELISSVSEDPSLETIDAKLEALAALVSAGQLNAGQVNKLFELMSTVLEIVDQVAAESDENGEEMMDDEDDDDDEGPSGALEEADVVVGDLISLVEAIAKNNKDLFIKAFTPNLWVYQRMVEIAGLVKKKGAKTAVPAFKDKFGPWFMCCMVAYLAAIFSTKYQSMEHCTRAIGVIQLRDHQALAATFFRFEAQIIQIAHRRAVVVETQHAPHAQESLQREIAVLVRGGAVREVELFPGVRVLGTDREQFVQFVRIQHAVLIEIVAAEQICQESVALRGYFRSFSFTLAHFNFGTHEGFVQIQLVVVTEFAEYRPNRLQSSPNQQGTR
jgi:hypothetical protein